MRLPRRCAPHDDGIVKIQIPLYPFLLKGEIGSLIGIVILSWCREVTWVAYSESGNIFPGLRIPFGSKAFLIFLIKFISSSE